MYLMKPRTFNSAFEEKPVSENLKTLISTQLTSCSPGLALQIKELHLISPAGPPVLRVVAVGHQAFPDALSHRVTRPVSGTVAVRGTQTARPSLADPGEEQIVMLLRESASEISGSTSLSTGRNHGMAGSTDRKKTPKQNVNMLPRLSGWEPPHFFSCCSCP